MDLRTALLIFLTGLNVLINYATGILFARSLGLEHFEEYAVAVAFVTMLSTVGELGLGKYAMRVLPQYTTTGRWQLAKGFRRFAPRSILLTSAVLLAGTAIEQVVHSGEGLLSPLVIATAFLPVLALAGYGAEVVQANLATLRSALITRLLIPGSTLLALLVWKSLGLPLSSRQAVVLFGAGWALGLLATSRTLQTTTPASLNDADPHQATGRWLSELVPFLLFAVLTVALMKLGLIVFRQVGKDAEVSIHAAVLETGTALLLVAKATDKMFLPEISQLLERGALSQLGRRRRQRFSWVLALCAAYLVLTALFGRQLLGLFGEGFEDGYLSLLVVVGGTAVWTTFSLAPSFLTYIGDRAIVVRGTGAALVVHVGLTYWLGASYGHLGAAIAFALPIACLYLVFSLVAQRRFSRFLREQQQSLEDGPARTSLLEIEATAHTDWRR